MSCSPAAPTPTQLPNEKSLETIHGQEVKTKVYREYRAAQHHEGICKHTKVEEFTTQRIQVVSCMHVNISICAPTCMHVCMCFRVYGCAPQLHLCVCPENAAKLRIALVKSHGLMMVKSLNGKVEQTSRPMQKWLEEHYHAEMKRYLKVVCTVCIKGYEWSCIIELFFSH